MSEEEAVPVTAGRRGVEERAARVVAAAKGRGVRMAVAESLTGGLLAATLVSVPGASRVFSGGVVAYDTALKHSLLGVDAERLRSHGPVDEQVALQMARGVRRACATPRTSEGRAAPAEIGLATTGVAGPDPDPQSGQPAGTVWIALSTPEEERSVRLEGLSGASRAEIRAETVAAVLDLALSVLAD